MSPIREIEKILLTATAPTGEAFAVVSSADGRCAVTRDAEPMDGLEWPIDRIEECTDAFLRLAGLSK